MTARIVAMLYCIIFAGLPRLPCQIVRSKILEQIDLEFRAVMHSGSSTNGVALSTQVVGEIFFHLNGMFVWHRVEMLEQLWQQPNTIFPDKPGRLIAVLVIFKSMIDRQSSHSNVDRRFRWIARRIAP